MKSKKVILVSYSGYPFSPTNFLPDNGLANLAGALISEGYKVKILDYNTPQLIKRLFPPSFSRKFTPFIKKIFEENRVNVRDGWRLLQWERRLRNHWDKEVINIGKELCEMVRNENPLLIGFKLWNGDGFSGTVTLAKMIKKYFPHLPVIGGGPHVDIFREYILKDSPYFDVLVYGEGELTITSLAHYFFSETGKLKSIPNIIFRSNNDFILTPQKWISNLDSLPYPVYDPDVYPSMEGDEKKIKMFVIDESRGCNNKCFFCIHPVKSGKLRLKSPERVVEELKRLKEKFHTRIFRYAGSSTPLRILRKIAEIIIRENLNIEYTTFGHIRGSNLEDFKILKNSGCYAMFFGIESGNQEILDEVMNKNVKVENIKKSLLQAKEAGIFVAGSLIYPSPGENEKTMKETLQLLEETKPDSTPVQFPLLTPHTTWGKTPEKYGFKLSCSYEKFLKIALRYKIKFLFPPQFWVPFPYLIGGAPFRTCMKKLAEFEKNIENLGILTTVSDEMALLAKYAGLSPWKFRDEYRNLIVTGNADNIEEKFVKEANKRAFV
ncbi:radical SAM protein [Candidatus Calescamantes bacterium]|nr:radical SAM protein [Candidatus Calescamantes bacterium]